MKDKNYRNFSQKAHQDNLKAGALSVCQFELTFKCGLRCRHCYTDCYNQTGFFKKELNTSQVKLVLDKLSGTGIIWLCFSGGDPLARDDFLELYSYAKKKGFLITIFTNGYSMDKRIIKHLKANPPFVIEITLNAVTRYLYEQISRVAGSFDKAIEGINQVLKANLPLKIKTQVTKDNFMHLPELKKFLSRLNMKFRPSHILYPRLNKDKAPCRLRIKPAEVLNLFNSGPFLADDCLMIKNENKNNQDPSLYNCAIKSADGIYLDPYGNIFSCNLIRSPKVNIIHKDILPALSRVFAPIREEKFLTDSKCRYCNLKESCCWCPGRALLETGSKERPINYYCKLANRLKQ